MDRGATTAAHRVRGVLKKGRDACALHITGSMHTGQVALNFFRIPIKSDVSEHARVAGACGWGRNGADSSQYCCARLERFEGKAEISLLEWGECILSTHLILAFVPSRYSSGGRGLRTALPATTASTPQFEKRISVPVTISLGCSEVPTPKKENKEHIIYQV